MYLCKKATHYDIAIARSSIFKAVDQNRICSTAMLRLTMSLKSAPRVIFTYIYIHSYVYIHNERNVVSNHHPLICLFNRLFRCGSRKTSKLRVTGLCEENTLVTVEFSAQRVSNAENVFIWGRLHATAILQVTMSLKSKPCVIYLCTICHDNYSPQISFTNDTFRHPCK